MGDDPNFRLKAFAVIACVLGVFLCTFVAQRFWYWLRTRKRDDVDTTRVAPIFDLGLLVVGAFVIWLAIEALILAIVTSALSVQPPVRQKIAEIEIGKLDRETKQTNLLFYRVDRAGRRMTAQRRPVLTYGDEFELRVGVVQWRGIWNWLGESGYYQFQELGGVGVGGGRAAELTSLDPATMPGGLGAAIFLQSPEVLPVMQKCAEGEIYDIILDPVQQRLEVRLSR